MNSFEIALEQLSDNRGVDGDGVKAMKICAAADDMLAALQAIDQATNGPWDGNEQIQYEGHAWKLIRSALAAALE